MSGNSNRWTIAYRQWQGKREYQEDHFAILDLSSANPDSPSRLFLVLADGMGGAAGGAQASDTVVRAFIERFIRLGRPLQSLLESCLTEANRQLGEIVHNNPSLAGMGSTVVAVHLNGKNLTWLSVGDSPMWLYSEGELTRLNVDHSMGQILDRMVKRGQMTEEQARCDARRNILLSVVTMEPAEQIDFGTRACSLPAGEFLLIASDGIETISDDEIAQHLADSSGDAETAASALLSAVVARSDPRQDNLTFLLLSGKTERETKN